jgi:hypothetical protein
MNFVNNDVFENVEPWQNDGKGNEYNNEISFIQKCLNFFFTVFFVNQFIKVFKYYRNNNQFFYEDYERLGRFLYNDIFDFINNIINVELPKKLLKYNGFSSDVSSSEDSSSDLDSNSEITEQEVVVVKYEDKYLDDIKKMAINYKLNWTEMTLRDKKMNELYEAHKFDLVNQKYKLNQEIVEKGMKYVEMDDLENSYKFETIYEEDNGHEFCSIKKDNEKEENKKVLETEINGLRAKLKELEDISEVEVLYKFKLEAQDFVINQRLDALKNNFIMEKTPLGNVIMYWNNSRGSFEYYSDNTIPYRYLETVGRKYIKTFNCRQIYVDMDFELSEFERKQKEKQEDELKKIEENKKMELELEKNTQFNSNLKKKDVFAKFKNYNKESGTGKVNRGVAPPKNSIPNNNNIKKDDEKTILKENANRYTCEGKIANFSFLKKPERKVIDKKYAMSFADFKKSIFNKNGVK